MNTLKIVLGVLMLVFSLSFAAPLAAGYVTSCGEITAPGIYELSADISTASTPTTTGACILITADNVEFNGNGHTVSASGMGEYGISILNSREVMVESTVLTNSYVGVNVMNSSSIALESNNARDNAWGYELVSSSDCTLRSNTAMHNSEVGFAVELDSDDNVLESNTASGNGDGIRISESGGAVPERNRVLRNTVNENDRFGIFVEGTVDTQIALNSIALNGYEGIVVVSGVDTQITSNTVRGNSRFGGNGQVNLRRAQDYYMYDNTISGPGKGVSMDTNAHGVFMGNTISDTDYAITVMSANNEISDNVVENSGIAFYSWDYSGPAEVTGLHMRQGVREVDVSFWYDHGTGNGFRMGLAPVPAPAPTGYVDFKDKCFQVTELGTVELNLYTDWPDSVSRGLGIEDSRVDAFRYDGGWVEYPAGHNTDGHKLYLKQINDFGTFCLFAEKVIPPTPPTPPTPPSGGGSSGGTTHSGGGSGAPHVGIPYVPSGGTTVEVEPSCTSDSDCATSATCSGGVCRALEAGGSCGAFVNHEWVDYDCCGGEDCNAGEVCKENECVPMEPLDITGTEPQSSGSEASGSDQGLGRLLADIPWWVLLILVLMVGGGIYARYRMGQPEQPPEGEAPPEEELPPAEPEEE
ncbi:right-handed parallel beta-helix repeat-containing protein, partial [Candidatus Micrarchaeota archaeon]|nr:right-handed parallel beta-helix repeat-containing protein [Candidatus Micrarchaeota archaeon]